MRHEGSAFEWSEGVWRLDFPRPGVDRLEYLLEVDGTLGLDPGNPSRVDAPFGAMSVVEWPGYEPPAWLGTIADPGPLEELELPCPALGGPVSALLYATPEPPGAGAPLLVVHDGPEYARYSGLTRFLDAMSWEERIPPLWAALVEPADRLDTYSASPLYADALLDELLPGLGRLVPHGRRIGMGASLGALAMLHAHTLGQEAFDGLFLQSGSFFRPRRDVHRGLDVARRRRIAHFVGAVLRGTATRWPIPVAFTCGTAESNLANNRAACETLARQGYPTWLAERRDAHNWTCWRDALDPNLPALVEAAHA